MTIVPIRNNNKNKPRVYTGCTTTDKILEDFLSKNREDIDEGDVRIVQSEALINRNTFLYKIVQKYYENLYGTEPAPLDEFGKSYVREPTEKRKSFALNSFFTEIQENFGATNESSNIKEEAFIWKGNGCSTCAQYDGQEFTIDKIPNTHPNCKCELVSSKSTQNIIKPTFDYEKYYQEKNQLDKDLLYKTRERLKDDEDIIDHPYLDTKGLITTGVGANIDSKEEFMKVNWQVDGRPATDAEKKDAFQTFEESKNNKEYGPKIKANYFVNKSNLRIDNKEANKIMDKHLEKNLKDIKNEVPNFDKLPKEMKEVLMDIKYNTGNVQKENWPNLHEAIKNKDIENAAKEVSRADIGKIRNNWARETILSIEEW